MRQRHRVSSESPPNAAIPEGVPTVSGGDDDGRKQWRSAQEAAGVPYFLYDP